MSRSKHPHGGHAPDHVREAFQNVVEAYRGWQTGPEPLVDFNGSPMLISIICGKCWNIADMLPRDIVEQILSISYPLEWKTKSYTFAAAARHLRTLIGIRALARPQNAGRA